jgi:NADH-quinone oxidoreductase subunit L
MHHEQDMRRMGNLKKYMPITFATMLTGWLAICGILPFAGFFSKDEILYKTFAANGMGSWNYVLWGIGLFTAALTAIYMTRLMVMTFWGAERFHNELPVADNPAESSRAEENAFALGDAHDAKVPHGDAHALAHHDEDAAHDEHDDEEHHGIAPDFKPHESPWTMTIPLIVLAILSTVGGLVGIPYALSSLVGTGDVNVFERTLEPVLAKVGVPHNSAAHSETATENVSHPTEEYGNAPISTVEPKADSHSTTAEHAANEHAVHSPEELNSERLLALLSLALGIAGIGIGWVIFKANPLRRMPTLFANKWYLDEIYNGYIVDPLTRFSIRGLWQGFDLGVIDGIVNGIGHFVAALGGIARGVQVGFVRSYAAFMLFGALIVIGYFIYYGFKLIG